MRACKAASAEEGAVRACKAASAEEGAVRACKAASAEEGAVRAAGSGRNRRARRTLALHAPSLTPPPRAVHRTKVRGPPPGNADEEWTTSARAAGPAGATAPRAARRVSQASGASARRLRELKETTPPHPGPLLPREERESRRGPPPFRPTSPLRPSGTRSGPERATARRAEWRVGKRTE